MSRSRALLHIHRPHLRALRGVQGSPFLWTSISSPRNSDRSRSLDLHTRLTPRSNLWHSPTMKRLVSAGTLTQRESLTPWAMSASRHPSHSNTLPSNHQHLPRAWLPDGYDQSQHLLVWLQCAVNHIVQRRSLDLRDLQLHNSSSMPSLVRRCRFGASSLRT